MSPEHASLMAERKEPRQNHCLAIKLFAWKQLILFLSDSVGQRESQRQVQCQWGENYDSLEGQAQQARDQ